MPKYAVVVSHDHPQRETFPQQLAFFKQQIVPTLKTMPGFAGGNWGYDTKTSRTHSYVMFESEPDARALIDRLHADDSQQNPFGIKLLSAIVVAHSLSQP